MGRPKKNRQLSSTKIEGGGVQPGPGELSEDERRAAELERLNLEREGEPKKKYRTKADEAADILRREQFDKVNSGLQAFSGRFLEIVNGFCPYPVEVSDTEKSLVSDSLTVFMELHADEFIESAPGYMLAGSLAMFALPRIIKTKGEGVEPEKSKGGPDNGENGVREKSLDPAATSIL